MKNRVLLRELPQIDVLISACKESFSDQSYPEKVWSDAARKVVNKIRIQILSNEMEFVPNIKKMVNLVYEQLMIDLSFKLKPVINATGVMIHTNLGRAPLPKRVAEHVKQVASGYSTLEYDIEKGERGSRDTIVKELLIRLTGCESALVVNNNAAGIMLALAAICKGRQVIVSRGELVEIGGSFRIPDVMAQSGALMCEVGTTNKTHIADYIKAIDPENIGGLLKVHTSNFKVVGFTKETTLKELKTLSVKQGIPLIYDLGSGAFLESPKGIFIKEPTVKEALDMGVDIITFSGDKLMGGPQAGIILGKKRYIDAIKIYPLARAVRIDKLGLAALEATLQLYLDPKLAIKEIPILAMLHKDEEELLLKAGKLKEEIKRKNPSLSINIEKTYSQVGGGSMPGFKSPSYGVSLIGTNLSANKIEKKLRLSEPSIIGRISDEKFIMDVRTIDDDDFKTIAATILSSLR